MQRTISLLLAIVALIHLLPVSGVFGAERLRALYALPLDDPGLLVLMRHRAVLFGLLGAFLLWGALRPQLVPAALIAGWVSVLSFLALAWVHPAHGEAVARVVKADLVAAACLAVATVLWAWKAWR